MGQGPNSLGVAGGKIWVANEFDGSITAIDPATNDPEPARSTSVARSRRLAADGDQLWLAVGASAAEHRGGTLTVSSSASAPDDLGPAVAYDYTTWADPVDHERRADALPEGRAARTE